MTDEEFEEAKSIYAWALPMQIMPDEAFDKASNHVRRQRTQLGRLTHDVAAGRYMAGWAFRPSFQEFADACRRESRTDDECAYIRELLTQMPIFALVDLLIGMDVTVFELARAMRDSGVDRSFTVYWINSFAIGYPSSYAFDAAADSDAEEDEMPVMAPGEYSALARTPA